MSEARDEIVPVGNPVTVHIPALPVSGGTETPSIWTTISAAMVAAGMPAPAFDRPESSVPRTPDHFPTRDDMRDLGLAPAVVAAIAREMALHRGSPEQWWDVVRAADHLAW